VAESFEQRQPFAPAWSGRKRVDPAILPALSRAADSIQGKMLDVARLSLALGFALVLPVAAAVAAAAAFLTFILVSAVETAPPHMHPPDQVGTARDARLTLDNPHLHPKQYFKSGYVPAPRSSLDGSAARRAHDFEAAQLGVRRGALTGRPGRRLISLVEN
jgi:hypothetical protein